MHQTADNTVGEATCTANFECLVQLLNLLDAYCAQHALDAQTASDLHLIAEEACVNVIQYAYPAGEPGPLRLRVQARAMDGRPLIELVIEDAGVPFDPLSLPEPDRRKPVEEMPAGGFGVTLIRRLSDLQHYGRSPDGHNVFTLSKFLPDTGSN